MAKKRSNRRATGLSRFAGPDAHKVALDALSADASAKNAKLGDNSLDPKARDERDQRHATFIEAAIIEIETTMKLVQKARQELGAVEKAAKGDGCTARDVADMKAAVKRKREAAKTGVAGIVAEHVRIGRLLRLLDSPLGTQTEMFPEEKIEPERGAEMGRVDAYVQGGAAWKRNEPISINHFEPGTQAHVDFERGFNDALTAGAMEMAPSAPGKGKKKELH